MKREARRETVSRTPERRRRVRASVWKKKRSSRVRELSSPRVPRRRALAHSLTPPSPRADASRDDGPATKYDEFRGSARGSLPLVRHQTRAGAALALPPRPSGVSRRDLRPGARYTNAASPDSTTAPHVPSLVVRTNFRSGFPRATYEKAGVEATWVARRPPASTSKTRACGPRARPRPTTAPARATSPGGDGEGANTRARARYRAGTWQFLDGSHRPRRFVSRTLPVAWSSAAPLASNGFPRRRRRLRRRARVEYPPRCVRRGPHFRTRRSRSTPRRRRPPRAIPSSPPPRARASPSPRRTTSPPPPDRVAVTNGAHQSGGDGPRATRRGFGRADPSTETFEMRYRRTSPSTEEAVHARNENENEPAADASLVAAASITNGRGVSSPSGSDGSSKRTPPGIEVHVEPSDPIARPTARSPPLRGATSATGEVGDSAVGERGTPRRTGPGRAVRARRARARGAGARGEARVSESRRGFGC